MYDVLFIHPPMETTSYEASIRRGATSEYPIVPMGLFTMADCLERAGFSVKIVNLSLERLLQPPVSVERMIRDLHARIYAIDLHWFVHSYGAIETAKLLKFMYPDSLVVLGGFTSSFFAEEIMRNYNFIDIVVVGEGEETIVDIASCRDKLSLRSVKGIMFRDKKKNVLFTGLRDSVPNLSRLVFTRVDLMEKWSIYLRCGPSSCVPTRKPSFWINVARGCNRMCSYCGGSRVGFESAMRYYNFRLRDPVELANDIEVLSNEYGVKIVKFSHDIESYGRKYYERLFNEIRSRGLEVGAYWDSFGVPREKLVESASKTFELGVCLGVSLETLDDSVRWRNMRLYTLAQFEKMLPIYEEKDILLDIYFLIGLPGDTRDNIRKIVPYSRRLMEKYKNVWVVPPFPYTIDPNSPMALNPEKYGIKLLFRRFEDYRRATSSLKWIDWVGHETSELSKKEIAELTLEVYKGIVQLNKSEDFKENLEKRYLFEHEGYLLPPSIS